MTRRKKVFGSGAIVLALAVVVFAISHSESSVAQEASVSTKVQEQRTGPPKLPSQTQSTSNIPRFNPRPRSSGQSRIGPGNYNTQNQTNTRGFTAPTRSTNSSIVKNRVNLDRVTYRISSGVAETLTTLFEDKNTQAVECKTQRVPNNTAQVDFIVTASPQIQQSIGSFLATIVKKPTPKSGLPTIKSSLPSGTQPVSQPRTNLRLPSLQKKVSIKLPKMVRCGGVEKQIARSLNTIPNCKEIVFNHDNQTVTLRCHDSVNVKSELLELAKANQFLVDFETDAIGKTR